MAFNFFKNAKPSTAPAVKVTTTYVKVDKPRAVPSFLRPGPAQASSSSSSSSSKKRKLDSSSKPSKAASASKAKEPAKKRKGPAPPERVLRESPVSSDEDEDDYPDPGENGSRTPRASGSASSSRSGTPFGGGAGALDFTVDRDVAHVRPASHWSELIHSEAIIRRDLSSYKPFFLADGDDKPTTIELEYPGGGSERFLLLVHKKKDGEYDPIAEVARIIRTVLAYFIPPDDLSPSSSTADSLLAPLPQPTAGSSPLNPSSSSSSDPTSTSESAQILRLLARSIAPNILSRPLFLQAVSRYNELVARLRREGKVLETIEGMRGVNRDVWSLIGEQVYQRVVGPQTDDLKSYVPFSDNVYGELTPRFVSQIAAQTGLTSSSTFVDLGSGVANCLLQTALQVGCASYGCEQLAGPARMARGQLEEARRRWALWGLRGGRMKAWEGDFCELTKVAEVLKNADVVLVNNYAFSSTLNDRLSLLFLDLKEGAHIVSLRPFVPHDFRLSARTCSSPQAILAIKEHRFSTQAVSWTHEGGVYYLQTVDRSALRRWMEDAKE